MFECQTQNAWKGLLQHAFKIWSSALTSLLEWNDLSNLVVVLVSNLHARKVDIISKNNTVWNVSHFVIQSTAYLPHFMEYAINIFFGEHCIYLLYKVELFLVHFTRVHKRVSGLQLGEVWSIKYYIKLEQRSLQCVLYCVKNPFIKR